MKLSQLQVFFPAERHGDLHKLYRRYVAKSGDENDIEGFVAQLHDQGLLSGSALREIFANHEVSLSETPPTRGRRGDRYTVVCELGAGAMGEVLLARDPELRRTVALKRVKPELMRKPALLKRFFAEAQITAQLDHPSIVPIYGLEVDREGRLSYAMKFVRGKTLTDYIVEAREAYKAGGDVPEDYSLKARVETFLPALQAMAYAHKRGVIHRDLKPDNIMLGAFGEVLVMDWGIARPIGDRERVTTGSGRTENTRAGSLVGTPAYMSPEQAQGWTEALDATSDQYALGLILHELVTLKRARWGESQLEIVTKAADGMTAPVSHAFKERVPRELGAIIKKATAKDPDARYASCEAFEDDLRRYLRDVSVHADPDRGMRKVSRWVGKHRALSLAFGMSLILVMAGVGVLLQWQSAVAMQEVREASMRREQQQREASLRREKSLQALTSKVVAQTARMNGAFSEYERLVHGIATATIEKLSRPAPAGDPPPLYKYLPNRVPDTVPSHAVKSKAYNGDTISFDDGDFAIPPDVDPADLSASARRIHEMVPTLRRAALSSHSDGAPFLPEAEQRRLILEEGVPIVWAYIALEDGLMVGYPGTWTVTDYLKEIGRYDPRETEWYGEFARKRGAVWSSAGLDESGLGILMSCAESLYGGDGTFLGVTAVDLTLEYFIDTFLEHPDLTKPGVEAIVLDDKGHVLVRSSQKDIALEARVWKVEPYDDVDVLEAIEGGESGYTVIGDVRLAMWSRLTTLPWTYVVVGPVETLLAGTVKGR